MRHAITLCLFAAALTAQAQVKVIPHDTTIDVTVDGHPFTTYHFADDYFHAPVRPFLYPVLASDGFGITTDQQQTDVKHGYQRSIWVGHGDVNGSNHWKYADPQAKQKHIKFNWIHSDGFQEQLVWTDRNGDPQLNETRTLRFQSFPDGARGIEVTLALTPSAGDVVFGTHGDRGLLSVRMLQSMYHTPTFLSAEGTATCENRPPAKPRPAKGAPVPAASEDDAGSGPVTAIRTAWCDESGPANNGIYGAAIFDAPTNPRHAPMWHARPDARLATDPTAVDHQGPIHGGPMTLTAGTTTTFRYEIIVHKGPGSSANLQAKYKAFLSSK